MKTIPLSKRLNTVKQLIPKSCNVVADIGSDHAYLPCQICLENPDLKAIAGEVNDGPKQAALNQVKHWQLSDRIDVRLGDGLSVIDFGEVDCVTIAGMGGALITHILTKGIAKLNGQENLVLQPNIDAHLIRQFANDYGYYIEYENVLEEDGYYYDIIVLKHSVSSVHYSDKEIYLGPLMLNQPNQAFYEKWLRAYKKQQLIVDEMHKAKEPNLDKIKRFQEELLWIEEALDL
ncbi:tRNA (adenine(22)-N(1))-methyltransferase [Alkalibacillus sp. S2W]|uniref:tRNA (adenine(22)-N(1))-methyltransferase n=1 Tax=Alkalibacillus sp. S2W TaxID=3386553 RepID=UPI00398D09EB